MQQALATQQTNTKRTEKGTNKLYWNRYKPDITLTDAQNKITYLIEIIAANTHNIEEKSGIRIEEFIQLAEEMRETWH